MSKIIADESIDSALIASLRKSGLVVLSIAELQSGVSDEDVLETAFNNAGLLITEDKDFGELTYRLKKKHCGILLIRLNGIPRNTRVIIASESILTHIQVLINSFSVIDSKGLRIKPGFDNSNK